MREHVLPHDIAAEKAVIGSLLLDPACYRSVTDFINAESFHLPVAGDAFRAIEELLADGGAVDPVVVFDRIRQRGRHDATTATWLADALTETPHTGHIEHYAKVVKECHARRKLAAVAGAAIEAASDPTCSLGDTVARLSGELYEIAKMPGAKEWGEIVSFERDDLPAFPVGALPNILRGWVHAVSTSSQTPPDMAAMLGLAVVSACIARRVDVEVTPDWKEPTNLFVAVELAPANRKSSVHAESIIPLREIEREDAEAAAPVVAKAQSERRRMQSRLAKLEKVVADKGDPAAAAEADEIAMQLATTPEAVGPRRIVDESTPEELAKILAAQGGRIASMSAEGGVFDMLSAYSKNNTPNVNVFLQAHAGDVIVIDRVSRPSLRVERPALTCAYAVQPQVIETLAANKVFRGRGLCARFAYASPKSWIGSRDVNPPPVPDGIRHGYKSMVRRLARLDGEHVLRLSPDAADDRVAWSRIIESMLSEGGELDALTDWGGKAVGLTVRIAGILHCIEHDGPFGDIDQETFQSAVEIVKYLIPHARHVLRRLAADDGRVSDDGQYVVRWIVRHDRREFTKRELYQQAKTRFRKVEDLGPALADLMARNFIRPVGAQPGGRGRPSEQFEVNPSVFETSRKPSPESPLKTPGDVSGDFGDGIHESQFTELAVHT